MEVIFAVKYHEKVRKVDLPALDTKIKAQVRRAVETKLMHFPLHFALPLRKSLKNYFKIRVGSYRVVFKIVEKERVVQILAILHRSVVYKKMEARIT